MCRVIHNKKSTNFKNSATNKKYLFRGNIKISKLAGSECSKFVAVHFLKIDLSGYIKFYFKIYKHQKCTEPLQLLLILVEHYEVTLPFNALIYKRQNIR